LRIEDRLGELDVALVVSMAGVRGIWRGFLLEGALERSGGLLLTAGNVGDQRSVEVEVGLRPLRLLGHFEILLGLRGIAGGERRPGARERARQLADGSVARGLELLVGFGVVAGFVLFPVEVMRLKPLTISAREMSLPVRSEVPPETSPEDPVARSSPALGKPGVAGRSLLNESRRDSFKQRAGDSLVAEASPAGHRHAGGGKSQNGYRRQQHVAKENWQTDQQPKSTQISP
jgi:hypothetical protein